MEKYSRFVYYDLLAYRVARGAMDETRGHSRGEEKWGDGREVKWRGTRVVLHHVMYKDRKYLWEESSERTPRVHPPWEGTKRLGLAVVNNSTAAG